MHAQEVFIHSVGSASRTAGSNCQAWRTSTTETSCFPSPMYDGVAASPLQPPERVRRSVALPWPRCTVMPDRMKPGSTRANSQ